MSKARKFIRENTKNCGNVCSYNSMECAIPWLTPDDARRAVEIAKEEVIEKICSFIEDNIAEYINIRGYTGNTFIDVESDRFINDLKQAIKYE